MITHWTVAFLYSTCTSPVVLILVLLAGCFLLIRFNDWYIVSRAAHRESSVRDLEALFALEDCRSTGRPRPRLHR